MVTRKFDLEERLVSFAVKLSKFAKNITKDYTGEILIRQMMRASTSSALNYGEAQGAESRRDFIHKMRIVLKELRELLICLKLIERMNLTKSNEEIQELKKESNALISIFVRSIQTASKNLKT